MERFAELGATVIAVAPHTVAEIEDFVTKHPLPFDVVADPDHKVFDAYDVRSTLASLGQRPAVFVVDSDGIVRYDAVGTQQWQIPGNDELFEVLRSLGRGTGS